MTNDGEHYVVKLKNGIDLPMPNQLYTDMDILLDDVKHSEMDAVIVVDGKEGTGKSRTARILGSYCSYRLNVPFGPDNIHFTTKDYINTSEDSSKYWINILDESREALNRKRSMSKGVVRFTNWLSENRDKQQIHIIVLPAVHDLDSYITTWRMSLLIHHLKGHGKSKTSRSGYRLIRGHFKVYESGHSLQTVIYNRAKYGYYAYPVEYKYKRKFLDVEPFTHDELVAYKAKKAEKRKEKYEEESPKNKFSEDEKFQLAIKLRDKKWILREISETVGIPVSTLSDRFRAMAEGSS